MDIRTDGPIFLRIPDGDIANVLTFNDSPFQADYQLYNYRTWFPRPSNEGVEALLAKISRSSIFSNLAIEGHYVIHQHNGSWVGSGFDEFREQLTNQWERYEAVSDEYSLKRYKCESAIYFQLLSTGDYLVINVDPWVHTKNRETSATGFQRKFRHFEVRLLLDGLPLNDGRFKEFLQDTDLRFGTGKPWNPTSQRLGGRAVGGLEVDIIDHIKDDSGYIEYVLCENPLFKKDDFVARFFPSGQNIVAEHQWILASCDIAQETHESAKVGQITITDYNEIGRHITQNISMRVSLIG